MIRRPPSSTRTYKLFPCATRLRSHRSFRMKHAPALIALLALSACGGDRPAENATDPLNEAAEQGELDGPATAEPSANTADRKIGRAHVSPPVTNAPLVCRLLLEKNKIPSTDSHHSSFNNIDS